MRELRLRTSLMLLLVTAAMMTFTVIGSAILLFRLPQVETRALEQLKDRADETVRLLDRYTGGVEAQLMPVARLLRHHTAAGMRDHLEAVVGDGENFDAVFIVAADGSIDALSLPPKFRKVAAELAGADFSGNRLFQAARVLAASGATSQLWSDKYLSPLSGKQTVGIAIPVGERVIIGEASLEGILRMIKDAVRHDADWVVIIDGHGQWLASSNPDPNPPGRHYDYSGMPEYQAALAGKSLSTSVSFMNKPLYASFALSPKLRWVIAATTPAGWGHYSYRITILMVIGAFFGALLISLALAPLWAARMARPLKRMIERTHAAIQGDYTSPWPQRGPVAELNQLSGDLGRLVDTVQAREAGMLRSEERLRATLETTPSVAIQWFDASGRVLYWNKASEFMYGFSADEAVGTLIGDNPLMYLDRKQADDFVAVLKRIESSGGPFGPAEFPLQRKNGTRLVVLATTFAIPGDDGKPIFVCMDVDVTERKRAEAALHAGEAKLEAIFNASPAAMSVSDPDHNFRFITANQAWEKQFRRRREKCVGLNGQDMMLWARIEDRQHFLAALERSNTLEEMEAELLTGDGQPLLCRISARIVTIGNERLMLMMSSDITAQRRIEREIHELNAALEERVAERTEELLQTNDELEATVESLKATQEQLVQSEKLAALGNLVAGVAHELNTPIGNGLMAVSTVRDRLVEFREAMAAGLRRTTLDDFVAGVDTGSDIAMRNLRRAAELVTSFKQVAVDQTSSQRRAFRVREVVDEILMTLHPTLKRTPYRVETEIADTLELDSYPGPLGQALTNLINNAVIHGFENRDHGTIRITAAAKAPGNIAISVRDDGRGIPAERLGRIFDPFYTTRMGRGGTGLGLHVVHNLVTNVLGGTLTVSSREEEGTEFVMLLPERATSREV